MDAASPISTGPAEKLKGITLEGKWLVVERLSRNSGGTGHSRSSCYKGRDTAGNHVFIKACDFRHREIHGELKELQWMVGEFLNESRIHAYCAQKGFQRTTRLIHEGKILIEGEPVHFLVCESEGFFVAK